MLLRKMPLQMFVEHIRSKLLPKKYREKVPPYRNAELQFKKLPLKMLVKNSCNRMRLKKYQENVPLKTTPSNSCSNNCRSKRLSKIPVAKSCRKKYYEKVSLKTTELKCCSENCRSKRSSKLSVAECCQKNVPRKSATKNNSTKLLLRKLPLETVVEYIHSGLLPKSTDKKCH